MPGRGRLRRILEPQTSHFEYIDLKEGTWYRRGPPCPTCGPVNFQLGVLFREDGEQGPTEED